jgi:hypothetical protein
MRIRALLRAGSVNATTSSHGLTTAAPALTLAPARRFFLMHPMHKARSLCFAFGLALFSFAATLAAQAPQWKTVGSAADGFRASFPTEPEVGKDSVPVGSESFELHSYLSEVGSTALYIAVCDYGPTGAAADPATLLASAKEGAVSHISAHILTEKKITLDSSPGVEFEAESDKLHVTARMYMASGVLFQSMVATPLNEKYADTARFLDSLQLIPRPHTEAAAAPPPADWKPYPVPSDGFSASFPSRPSSDKQNVPAGAGTVEYHSYTAEDNSTTLIAGVTDFGPALAGKDPDAILQGAKNGAVTNSKGKLVSEKPITLGANHGIAFEIDSDSARVTARVYLVGTSIYEMIVASPLNSNYADTARFLDSLKLIDRDGK